MRLLKPFDFGVFGAATLVWSAVSAATELRMGQALIQQQDRIDPYLDTLFTVSLLRNLVIIVALVVFSHPFGAFFHLGGARTVFWAVAPLPFLQGIQSPRLLTFYRQLDFHFLTIFNVSEVTASFVFGLMAVLYWRDWRGLVFASFAGAMVRAILTYWFFPYRPRLRIDPALAKKMLSFGLWLSAASFCEYIARQLDNFTVGHLLGPKALGNYQMAFRAGEMPVAEFTLSAALVTFPMAARLRGNARTRWRLFWSVIGLVAAVGVTYSVFIFLLGNRVVLKLFGTAWVGAVPALKVLSIYGLLQGGLVVSRSFLNGLGRPQRYLMVGITRAVVLAIAIYPLTLAYGLTGAGTAGVISIAAALPVAAYMLRQTN